MTYILAFDWTRQTQAEESCLRRGSELFYDTGFEISRRQCDNCQKVMGTGEGDTGTWSRDLASDWSLKSEGGEIYILNKTCDCLR